MRKLVLSSLIGILSFLFMSCGFTEGTVTVYNDSDIVVRVVFLITELTVGMTPLSALCI